MKEKNWYPAVEDIEKVHDDVLEQNPEKYPGTRVSPLTRIPEVITEARNTPGHYKSAAVLLKRIASEHVFEDGNTTTAILIAKKFLERNNKEFKPNDHKLTGKVANNHGLYSVEEIAHYFKTGEIDETKYSS
ncbi:MAG: hypothetical protein BRC29_03740 [Nanohaloarchaea archaeon SW_7_43_1]|nr:MAG: hypothetical protein BRC29_03740 [Nanohaloarchaea archaeon SW_7_43_1]